MTLSRPEVRRLLASEGIRPSRALGQNFVVDPNTARRVARLSGAGSGDQVVEVGAGLGSLTLALLETGANVTAVEIDDTLIRILSSVISSASPSPSPVRIVRGDALRLDWDELLRSGEEEQVPDRDHPVPWIFAANLPYNIATPLVAKVLDEVPRVKRMTVMVQREVGERLAAGPGDPAYGAPSVKVAYHATAAVLARVPPTVFMPRPNVESVVIGIDRRDAPAVDPQLVSAQRLFTVVKAGFGQRRKMLRRALAGIVDPEAFEATDIEPTSRAEELGVEAWGRLAAWRGER